MSNQDQYFTVNIRAYLDMKEPTYIGEEELHDLLSDFSCHIIHSFSAHPSSGSYGSGEAESATR